MTSGSAGVSSSGSLKEYEDSKRDPGIHHRADPAGAHGIDRAPGILRHAPDPGAAHNHGRMEGMKRMKRKIAIALMALMLTGCANIERAEDAKTKAKDTSRFALVERTMQWEIVYDKKTGVMYAVSWGNYNTGNFTLLVDAEGKPLIYEGVERP